MRRYIIAVILVLVVVVGFIVIIARQGNDQPEQDYEVAHISSLVEYAPTNTHMRLTINGRIISSEEHRVIQITVGRDERVMEVQRGYQGDLITRERFSNNVQAYEAFLAALQNEGYTRSRTTGNILEEGACPTGQRFEYEILTGEELQQSLWSTSCTNIPGTFNGRASIVRSLFQAQIPNYNEITRSITL